MESGNFQHKIDDWNNCVARYPFSDLNWSVYEHEQVRCGDQCYLVRVGSTNTGVVLKGKFISEPKRGNDWSGKNRITYYCDIMIQNIANADIAPFITTKELQDNIPSFEWTKGHSGRLLTCEEANQLEQLWDEYSKRNAAIIEQQRKQFDLCIEKSIVHKIKGFNYLIDYFKSYWENTYQENPDCIYKLGCYHDTCNLEFKCDYDKGQFTLKYMLQEAVLPIICSNLCEVKMNLYSCSSYMDWFRIYSLDEEHLCLEANGIEVICKKYVLEKPKNMKRIIIP